VAVLSGVFHSKRAVQANAQAIRIFVLLRRLMIDYAQNSNIK
jgi:hypothetical protein